MTTLFNDEQMDQIMNFMGYPWIYRDNDPRCYNALITVQQYDAVANAILSVVAQIQDVETKIDIACSAAMDFKTEETETDFQMQIETLKNRGRMLIGRIATRLYCPIRNDYFSPVDIPEPESLG